MSQVITNDAGEELTVFTEAEVKEQSTVAVEAAKKEIMESTGKTIAEKEAEIQRLAKVSAEKTQNFKRYNEMTIEEKKVYDANTTELLKRDELRSKENEDLRNRLEEKEKREKESVKRSVIDSIHNNDEKIKKEVEKNYDMLAGMPETTPEEIHQRAIAAARLAGVQTDPRNPLYTAYSGEAPKSKPEKDPEFTETTRGKEAEELARQALNIKAVK